MNDLQAKFAIMLVGFGLLWAYAVPTMKQTAQNRDEVTRQVGQVYIGPNPYDPSAPSGNVSVDDLRKYSDQKAAERRKALGLQ